MKLLFNKIEPQLKFEICKPQHWLVPQYRRPHQTLATVFPSEFYNPVYICSHFAGSFRMTHSSSRHSTLHSCGASFWISLETTLLLHAPILCVCDLCVRVTVCVWLCVCVPVYDCVCVTVWLVCADVWHVCLRCTTFLKLSASWERERERAPSPLPLLPQPAHCLPDAVRRKRKCYAIIGGTCWLPVPDCSCSAKIGAGGEVPHRKKSIKICHLYPFHPDWRTTF